MSDAAPVCSRTSASPVCACGRLCLWLSSVTKLCTSLLYSCYPVSVLLRILAKCHAYISVAMLPDADVL